MFSRFATLSMLALPLFAAATSASVVARNDAPAAPSGSPATACCSSTESANSAAGSALLGLIGVVLSNPDVLLGLDCSPISVVGVGSGSECSGTTVSCSNGIVGSIGIGCVPITA